MHAYRLTRRIISVAILAVATGSAPAWSCSCTRIVQDASKTSGLVMAGSEAVSGAMNSGFQMVGRATANSTSKQSKSLVSGLEAMTSDLVSEIRQIPVTEDEIERRQDMSDPSRQATAPCRYSDRSKDMGSAQKQMVAQQDGLNEATADYNELPSTNNNPQSQSPESRFNARARNAFKQHDELMEIGPRLLNSGESYGALSEEETQSASLFNNMSTNPNPPARTENPNSLSGIEDNVNADLHNMRMTMPQAVMNQLIAYESPALEVADESWVKRQFQMAGLDATDKTLSYGDLIKAMATHRIESPEWVANLSVKDTSGAAKDLAYTKADAAFLDYEIWKQEKNTALLMSQLLAEKVRSNREQ